MFMNRSKLRRAMHPDGGPETEYVLSVLEPILSNEQAAEFEAAMIGVTSDDEVKQELAEIKERLESFGKPELVDSVVKAIEDATKPNAGISGGRRNG